MKKFLSAFFALLLIPCFPLSASSAVSVSARAAVVMEASTGTVLYEKNADQRLPEASTTKIMTALLVLEKGDPDALVTISPQAANVEGSQLGIAEGDKITVRDLLYVLMLKSGNDAAVALAEYAGGTVDGFVSLMNAKAAELGLTDTQFRNPHGLPDDEHYTTARDLAELTAFAMENPAFCQLVGSRTAHLNYKNLTLANSNRLLTSCEGVCGVKTGFTKKAGRCLVSAARRQDVLLICVTLNDPDDWSDHTKLYDTCFSGVTKVEITAPGDYAAVLPVLGGEGDVHLTNSRPLTGIAVDGKLIPYRVEAQTLPMAFAPLRQGTVCGTVFLCSEQGRILSQSPLCAENTVAIKTEKPSFFRRFLRSLKKISKRLTHGKGKAILKR